MTYHTSVCLDESHAQAQAQLHYVCFSLYYYLFIIIQPVAESTTWSETAFIDRG